MPWIGYPAPVVKYIKRFGTDGIYAQFVETALHVGTHIDAPMHYILGGKDVASIPLDRLYGPGVVVDISDVVGEWDIIKPEHVTSKIEVKKGDILVYHTGFHHLYTKDEEGYLCRHPGPSKEFAEWALRMDLRWIGVDCGSADHPMNTYAIPKLKPDLVKEYEKRMGKSLEEIFPRSEVHPMHKLFRHDLIHAENVGGDIDEVLNKRVMIGAFPWRFVGGEASISRIVAFVD